MNKLIENSPNLYAYDKSGELADTEIPRLDLDEGNISIIYLFIFEKG